MFIKTIAVGPLLEVWSCVTGGTTVAMPLDCCHDGAASLAVNLATCEGLALRARRAIGVRMLILGGWCSGSKVRSAENSNEYCNWEYWEWKRWQEER